MSTRNANGRLVDEVVALGLPRREANWLVEEYAPGGDIEARAAVLEATARCLGGEPIQYVVGRWPFRSREFDLDNRVLIPRPETESLVDVALSELAGSHANAPLVLDMGCGSGVIGISIVLELDDRGVAASLIGLDASNGALAVARRNAMKHGVTRASFVESDWYVDLDDSLRGRVNLIVANPPYVSESEFVTLDPVLRYEPRSALVAGDALGVSGFADVAAVIDGALDFLAPNAALVVEHSHLHGGASRACARERGFSDVRTVSDLAGLERILVARKS